MASNREIQFPIFVRARDCGDVAKYSSVHELQYDLEQIDVENDEYEAWEANGFRISLGIQKPLWLKIELIDDKPLPTELATAISEYAHKQGLFFQSSDLIAGKYSELLDRVEGELKKKKRATWPHRLFGRAGK
jgi:hypothetical protein